MKKIFLFGILFLCSCGPINNDPTQVIEMKIGSSTAEKTSGYSVTRVGIFADDLAYRYRRGIYEIVDLSTGKKYIGVSGIGISETGSHDEKYGKQTVTVEDER